MTIKDAEKKMKDSMRLYSIYFLNAAMEYYLTSENDKNTVLCISNIQLAFELALKSTIIHKEGLRCILSSAQSRLSDTEIVNLISENRIKLKEFDSLKNFIKSHQDTYEFEREQYKYMEQFQFYRNKILHCGYVLTKEEKCKIRADVLNMLSYVLIPMLNEAKIDGSLKMLKESLNQEIYFKLMNDVEFEKEIDSMIIKEYGKSYECPYCQIFSVTPSMVCMKCMVDLDTEPAYKFLECPDCGDDTLLVDSLNLANNDTLQGYCLSCNNYHMISKCPVCGEVYINEIGFKHECIMENYN